MIIKIMKTNRIDFWMCDNVESLQITEAVAAEPIKEVSIPTSRVVCNIYEFDPQNPDRKGLSERRLWVIDFKLKGDNEQYAAFFNTIAYLCNDIGQTIERVCG